MSSLPPSSSAAPPSIALVLHVAGHDEAGRPLVKLLKKAGRQDWEDDDHPVDRFGSVAISQATYIVAPRQVHLNQHHMPPTVTSMADPVPDVRIGDLITAAGARAKFDLPSNATAEQMRAVAGDAAVLHLEGVEIVARDLAPAEAAEHFQRILDADRGDFCGLFFMTASEIEHHLAMQIAQAEPDDALMAAWVDEHGRLETHVVGHRGAYLLYASDQGVDDHVSLGLSKPPGPGLWYLEDGKPWSYQSMDGDYESGIDGIWVAATDEHLALFGLPTDLAGLDTLEERLDEAGLLVDGRTPREILRAASAPSVDPLNCVA